MDLPGILSEARAEVRSRRRHDAVRDAADVRAIDAACAAAPSIAAALTPAVAAWQGRFQSRARLILRARLDDGSGVVIKIGNGLVAEGEVLDRARRLGLHSVRPRGWGAGNGVEWLLLDEVRGIPPPVDTAADIARLRLHTRQLAAETARLHRSGPEGLRSPSLREDAWPDLTIGVRTWAGEGLVDGGACEREFQRLASTGDPVLLHGDLTPANLLIDGTSQVVLLDPVGSHGPKEFDMARWFSRLMLRHGVSAGLLEGLVADALAGDPTLERAVVLDWTNLLVHVDYPHLAAEAYGMGHATAVLSTAARLAGNDRLGSLGARQPLPGMAGELA